MPFEAATAIWERLWTSRYPLAADAFDDGVWRQTRAAAMTRQHVELHPKHVWGLIGVDVDHPDAVLRMVSTVDNHPPPNVIIENPVNGHAHAAWAITTPINLTNYGSRRSVRYGLSIEEALRRAVGGDPHYPARLIKNPFHPRWMTHFIHDNTSTLDRLGGILTPAGHMPGRGWHNQRRRTPVGHSRNETLFHGVRHFAYREMRHHWGDADGYRAAIAREVAIRNADFDTPLGVTELGHISTSITGLDHPLLPNVERRTRRLRQSIPSHPSRTRTKRIRTQRRTRRKQPTRRTCRKQPTRRTRAREGTARRVSVSPGGDG
ncbi:replication initiation protein [Pseudonocardia sp. Ae707_Ps2]|uniref:replication initiation protein n=1 Tax=Pseudonocardia sp. Ae707_Ps2 TaxID=2212992 RepID=UPI00307EF6D6